MGGYLAMEKPPGGIVRTFCPSTIQPPSNPRALHMLMLLRLPAEKDSSKILESTQEIHGF